MAFAQTAVQAGVQAGVHAASQAAAQLPAVAVSAKVQALVPQSKGKRECRSVAGRHSILADERTERWHSPKKQDDIRQPSRCAGRHGKQEVDQLTVLSAAARAVKYPIHEAQHKRCASSLLIC